MVATHYGRQSFTISVMGSPRMIRAGRLLGFRELEGCRRLVGLTGGYGLFGAGTRMLRLREKALIER